jgi:hypothetical protein
MTETQVVFSSAFERRPLRLGREVDPQLSGNSGTSGS